MDITLGIKQNEIYYDNPSQYWKTINAVCSKANEPKPVELETSKESYICIVDSLN